MLTVRDTGTGIPADELPRLFERFHRVEGARGRTHEGSGIGLALVQELVELHGGTVARRERVDSAAASPSPPARTRASPADRIAARSTACGAHSYVEGSALALGTALD